MKIILAILLSTVAKSEPGPQDAKTPVPYQYIRTQVSPDVFPFVAFIAHRVHSSIRTGCAGTILNSHWVLTSGACAYNTHKSLSDNILTVHACASSSFQRLEDFKQIRKADQMVPHPKHINGSLKYNSGVLRVKKPFVFNDAFRRVRFHSVDLQTASARLQDIIFDFRKRRCEECSREDVGKYDCKMVSWKVKEHTTISLMMLEVVILAYDECDKINSEFRVMISGKASVGICVQPKRFDIANPKGSDMLAPAHFYANEDDGAPLICNECGTEKYQIWGTFTKAIYGTVNESTSLSVYAYFTTIESILYKYQFHDPYGRNDLAMKHESKTVNL